jgi:hypothetical protein
MTTGPPAPDDRQHGNGQPPPPGALGPPGGDPLDVARASLGACWALVLRRFRDYAQRFGGPAAGREPHREADP